jgi:polar amino acid transport system substrate-binding protein
MRKRGFRSLVAAACVALAASAVLASGPARADAYDDIMRRGKMIVAIDPTFAPYETTDSSGNVIGYNPDLLAAIAAQWGVEIDYQVMAFGGVIPGLIAGSFDFTATALNITAKRARKIAYTIPVAWTVNAVLRRKGDATVEGSAVDQLSGLACAVKQSTQPERMIRDFNKQLGVAGKPEIGLLSFETIEQAIAALVDHRVACVVDDKTVLLRAIAKRPDAGLELVGEIGARAMMGWGTNKSDPKLTEALTRSLRLLRASGIMGALQEAHLGYRMDDLPVSNFIPSE